MVMYDSLNRHFLPNYGCDISKMPNFRRLGERSVTFDNSYAGSLPCMPARRELHTGRLNFLHRGWCPLEPFDDSMPEILKNNGIYTHLVSDHQHYWEDGGATYHTRYSSWEVSRGQEGDPWKGSLAAIESNVSFGKMQYASLSNLKRQDTVNRSFIKGERDFPQAKTFTAGLDFIERNRTYDHWFLQIETFDPHEPFFSPEEYQRLYKDQSDEEFLLDWPPYAPVTEDEHIVRGVRKKYLSLLSMCDNYLGKVLDMMDRYDMWKDTMLIVNTDHGFLLGEHHWWAKSVMPTYNEIAHTPLFIWDPRSGAKNERRKALVQTIDLAPTVLDFFGVEIPKDMQGFALKDTIKSDKKVRNYALFGHHGAHINITDGHYVYMRAPLNMDNQPLAEYTLMPNLMRSRMGPDLLNDLTLHEPFDFTKGCRTLVITDKRDYNTFFWFHYGNKLFDLEKDPDQLNPIDQPEKELEMVNEMIRLMEENDAPEEQYVRMGISKDMTLDMLLEQRKENELVYKLPRLKEYKWNKEAFWAFTALVQLVADQMPEEELTSLFKEYVRQKGRQDIGYSDVLNFMRRLVPGDRQEDTDYVLRLQSRTE